MTAFNNWIISNVTCLVSEIYFSFNMFYLEIIIVYWFLIEQNFNKIFLLCEWPKVMYHTIFDRKQALIKRKIIQMGLSGLDDLNANELQLR